MTTLGRAGTAHTLPASSRAAMAALQSSFSISFTASGFQGAGGKNSESAIVSPIFENSSKFSLSLSPIPFRKFAMQDPRMVTGKEVPQQKQRKKKALSQVASAGHMKEVPKHSLKIQKGSKKKLKNEVTPPFQHSDRSASDSFPDSSGFSDEYRALRRKYLLLEEESFSLGKEMGDVEAEVKTLEDEKFALLDQLVVLEGLIDPSELQAKGGL